MRRIVTLRYLAQWPHARIAEQTGQTAAAVRMTCHRAIRRLRKILEPSQGKENHV